MMGGLRAWFRYGRVSRVVLAGAACAAMGVGAMMVPAGEVWADCDMPETAEELEECTNLPETDPNTLLQVILNLVYLVAGIVAVIFIVYGGIRYIISEGSPEKAKMAQMTITYAVIGLIVVLAAAAITNFVIGSLE